MGANQSSADLQSASLTTNETENDSIVSTSNNVSLSHALLTTGERVLLQTARVTICGSDGCKVSACLLLDSGSRRTFMTEQLATLCPCCGMNCCQYRGPIIIVKKNLRVILS